MKVFINPGHSKDCNPDAGCCYNGIKEATICAEIANFLADELLKANIPCTVYQQTGAGLTSNQQLNTVAKEANKSGADLFISIHMNGHKDETANGTEVWYQEGSVKGEAFAAYLINRMTSAFGDKVLCNRGTKVAKGTLAVLRDTSMPAALVEVCFISNKSDADFVKANRINVAKRLALAIQDYYGLTDYYGTNAKDTSKNRAEYKLEHVEDDKYDLYVDGQMILAANKFSTCIEYLESHYGV